MRAGCSPGQRGGARPVLASPRLASSRPRLPSSPRPVLALFHRRPSPLAFACSHPCPARTDCCPSWPGPRNGASTALRGDLVAGVTVALVLIPQALAYAKLAGLPPHIGLYAALVPAVVAALFGSCGQLSTGPVALTSLLVGASILPLAGCAGGDLVGLALLLGAAVRA